MKKNIYYFGPLFSKECEKQIIDISKGHIPSIAPNIFQWSLINGIQSVLKEGIPIINVLPVGTWPNQCSKLILHNRKWNNINTECFEIGNINLPIIKQLCRQLYTQKIVRKICELNPNEEFEFIVYSTYKPFLGAFKKLSGNIKISLIVTDLPEYYDLSATSRIKKIIRSVYNKGIYSNLKRIDRFILLTEHMKSKLPINDKPTMIMEGIFNETENDSSINDNDNNNTSIFYSGTLNYMYGIKDLLDAFKLINDPTIELWICGSGEAEKEIKELSKIDKRIRFFGFCTQQRVKELRNQASILINPRTNEGEYTKYSFPSKTMEYMASGKPVIMYKLSGVPDDYDQFLTYIDPSYDSSEAIKDSIMFIMKNINDALIKAEKAKQFILEEKNSIKQAKRLLDFIEYQND